MISPQPGHRDGAQRAFLVERYISPAAAEGLAGSSARMVALCAAAEHIGAGVQYLYSAYLPAEDTCFCLFQAVSSDAVRALNEQAGFALDRITDAVLLVCDSGEAQLLRRPL